MFFIRTTTQDTIAIPKADYDRLMMQRKLGSRGGDYEIKDGKGYTVGRLPIEHISFLGDSTAKNFIPLFAEDGNGKSKKKVEFDSVETTKLSPSEAIMAFIAWLSGKADETRFSNKLNPDTAYKMADSFAKLNNMKPARDTWRKNMIADVSDEDKEPVMTEADELWAELNGLTRGFERAVIQRLQRIQAIPEVLELVKKRWADLYPEKPCPLD